MKSAVHLVLLCFAWLSAVPAFAGKIALDPSMMSLEGDSSGDAGALVDEQALVGDPLNGDRIHASSTWGSKSGRRVNVAILDLGHEYVLSHLFLYDFNGSGIFRVQAGAPGAWDLENPIVDEDMTDYGEWKDYPTTVTTRYLRFENTTGYIGVPEIVLYGEYDEPEPLPIDPSSVKMTLDPSMMSLEGDSSGVAGALVDEQALVGDPLNGDRIHASSTWGSKSGSRVNVAVLDLGREYALRGLFLYDLNGKGIFRVQAGAPGAWDLENPIVDADMKDYKAWRGFGTNVTTRYLRFENTTGYVGVPEVVLYGAPLTPQKLLLDPSMMSLEGDSSGNAEALIDEQELVGDPLNGDRIHASSTWGSKSGKRINVAILDLGKEHQLTNLFLYDYNGKGIFRVQAGAPGAWDLENPIVDEDMGDYGEWKGYPTTVTTRYLRFENTTGYIGVPEIVLYGYAGGGVTLPNPPTQPTPPADLDLSHFGDGPISEARKIQLDLLVMNSSTQPAVEHPRLFGSNSKWVAKLKKFDDADPDCIWRGRNGWGYVKNMKELWDRRTLGGEKCLGKIPTSIATHPDAEFYLTGEGKWNMARALRLIHLMRRMYACYDSGSTNCLYSKAEINSLASKFLTYEFDRQKSEIKNSHGYYPSWHKGWKDNFFDLGAKPAFKFWCLLLDTFWDNPYLSEANKSYITAELENEIDSYLHLYNLPEGSPGSEGRWAVWGGNNWTVILNTAALYWANTFWYEKPEKARQVLAAVLETNWLHRDYYMQDGAYVEGPSYADASIASMIEQNELLKAGFGQPYHALRWKSVSERTTKWLLENVSTDGKLLDFGDAWARSGYSAYYYLYLKAWEELIALKPIGSTVFDACDIKQFFANNYYAKQFDDPWEISPILARDWYSIVEGCDATAQKGVEINHFPDYQLATFRTYLPGATQMAGSAGDYLKLTQADQTFLAMTGVPNDYPHREVDFGGVIWSAFGSKLLADFGYGELSNTYEYYKVSGSKGHFVMESDNDRLEFYLRMVDQPVDLRRLNIGITVHYVSKQLVLSDYVSELGSGWTKVSIPLKDFGVDAWRWTAIRGEEGDPWAAPGLEAIFFRNNGSIADGHLGLDQVSIVSGVSSAKNVLWYGDAYAGSIADGAREEHATNFKLVSEELSNGAASTSKWAKLYVTNSGTYFTMNYSNDPNEYMVANKMDYLPLGANTLILPKATENGKRGTHRSQFRGESGTLTPMTVDGKQVVLLDGSKVYGSERADGNLNHFYRYTVAIGNGDYVIVDSFKTKPGKEDRVQEFWYSLQDLSGADCSAKSRDISMQKLSAQSILLSSRCSHLSETGASESFGKITAQSLQGGAFQLGAPQFLKSDPLFSRFIVGNAIRLLNRLGDWEYRRLARYEPTATAVAEDVRVFLLQSATSATGFQASSVTKVACGTDRACFTVEDGATTLNVELGKVNDKFVLEGL